jgi:hypothetical protein
MLTPGPPEMQGAGEGQEATLPQNTERIRILTFLNQEITAQPSQPHSR